MTDYEWVQAFIYYHPDSGVCLWRCRDAKHFVDAPHAFMWNKRFCGKPVGSKSACASGNEYFRFRLNGRTEALHRAIWLYMTGEMPNVIDHIDGDSLNNKWENLRNVSRSDNCKNRRRLSGKSLPVGIRLSPSGKKFVANIHHNHQHFWLGTFEKLDDAISARKNAERKFGFHDNHGRVVNV